MWFTDECGQYQQAHGERVKAGYRAGKGWIMSDRSIEKEDTTRTTVRAHASHQRANSGRRIPQESIETVVRQIVERFKPEQIILFGSYAYGRPAPGSDVDLLVEFEGTPSFDRYMGLRIFLEDQLGRQVDLITRRGIREQILPHILKDAIRVA
jgi:hypothetical protein